MKFWLSLAILLSFVGIAGFGIFAMGHMGEHGSCIAATANGGLCPGEANPLAEIAFHFGAFKGFSTATFAGLLAGILSLALAFAYILRSLLITQTNSHPRRAFFSTPLNDRPLSISEVVLNWIALHENSPSFA